MFSLFSVGSMFDTYSIKTHVLLHFEHKNDVISLIIVKFLYRTMNGRRVSSVKFDNDCEVIFMFNMQ